MTADLIFFALSLAGVVAFLDGAATLRAVMVGAGGLLMLYFAVGAVREARADFVSGEPGPSPDDADARGFTKAFVLALTNPYQILFWLTVGVGLLAPGRIDVLSYATDALAGLVVVETGHPALLVGLFGGVLVWIVGFPGALVAAENRTETAAPVVAGLSAAVLVLFGLYFLHDAATGFGIVALLRTAVT
jgi:threonine/homoserine/homoserine lactone efflux protein